MSDNKRVSSRVNKGSAPTRYTINKWEDLPAAKDDLKDNDYASDVESVPESNEDSVPEPEDIEFIKGDEEPISDDDLSYSDSDISYEDYSDEEEEDDDDEAAIILESDSDGEQGEDANDAEADLEDEDYDL